MYNCAASSTERPYMAWKEHCAVKLIVLPLSQKSFFFSLWAFVIILLNWVVIFPQPDALKLLWKTVLHCSDESQCKEICQVTFFVKKKTHRLWNKIAGCFTYLSLRVLKSNDISRKIILDVVRVRQWIRVRTQFTLKLLCGWRHPCHVLISDPLNFPTSHYRFPLKSKTHE